MIHVEHADRRVLRWSGIAFAVLFVVGWILLSFTWDDPDNDREIIDFYTDSGNRVRQIVGAYLTALSGIAFVVFGQRLQRLLGPSWLGALVCSLATIFTTMVFVALVTIAAVSASVQFGNNPEPQSAELLRAIEGLGFGAVLLPGMIAVGTMALATSLVARATGVLPSWLVAAGYVVGPILILLGPLYFTLLLLVAWVLCVALTARTPGTAVVAETTTAPT